ncbi:MAG: tRNA glutamyl-Q(34) synthetase GluQRS [Labrys sp. (in: a-proteobacteria)]|jgi:glutamyl-Q tRNA(Asp) synthetase
MSRPILRFAPSPNGPLHLGHAYSALVNLDMARRLGGELLVRLEDIDTTRCREDFIAPMLDDLAWLGLPVDAPRRQSRHFADYEAALARLDAKGLVYPAKASRRAIAEAVAKLGPGWPRDPDGAPHYPRAAVHEDPREPAALRLDMARASQGLSLTWRETGAGPDGETGLVHAEPNRWGDAILRRKEFPASYAIAVVVDDALQGVTHVVRGQDLFHATALQRLLQHHLGLPEPIYHHHGLIRGPDGEKLSKSISSTALARYRAEGASVADIRRLVGLPVDP